MLRTPDKLQRQVDVYGVRGYNRVHIPVKGCFNLGDVAREVVVLTTTPIRKLRRRQRRRRKVRYLRRRLAMTKDPNERQRLIAKIRRISPRAPVPEA